MPLANAHKKASEELIKTTLIEATSPGRGKRKLSEMFMLLPDREAWAEYYKVIRRPRCLQGVLDNLLKGNYSSAQAVYDDLCLIFDNAMFYNEEESQIAQDAKVLKKTLQDTWLASTILPKPKQFREPSPKPPVVNGSPTRSEQHPAEHTAVEEVFIDHDIESDAPGTPIPTADEFPAREDDVEDIVQHLESGLPRWPGYDDEGWLDDPRADYLFFAGVLTALRGYKDSSGQRPIDTLDQIEEETTDRDLSFSAPLSVQIIETRARTKQYTSGREFDQDMARLFEKARRFHAENPPLYGKLLLCQRLYQELVATVSQTIPSTSSNFASIPTGPLSAPTTQLPDNPHLGELSHKVATEGRVDLDGCPYRGSTLRVGDWVHVMNPDDPSKPIVGQVWKAFTRQDRPGELFLTLCWYYRPEQTFHPPHRQFWENEVFKTAHYVEHNVRDVLEKIFVQFTRHYVYGRPRGPYWYPGWPLYVCDSRYIDRGPQHARIAKIHNWRACVPPGVRALDVPLYPFERPVYPALLDSPFSRGIHGPGAVVDPAQLQALLDRQKEDLADDGGTIAKRRPRRVPGGATPSASKAAAAAHEEPAYAGPTHGAHFPRPAAREEGAKGKKRSEEKTVIGAAGGSHNIQGHAIVDPLPPETTRLFDRDPETNQVLWFSGPPMDMARPQPPQHSLAYLNFLATKRKQQPGLNGDPSVAENGEHTPSKKTRLVPVSQRLQEAWAQLQAQNGESMQI
ncbi:hypothetical protein AURDEDRAFT_155279 [Auricularia subglabra TFB-10046 SS5]|nr:hypothetical protein AURDEDRAFT_155279 [Auricularia subglabra TFB-10046 SS5]